MKFVTAVESAIISAFEANTLNFATRLTRFGRSYTTICDEHGIITIAFDDTKAKKLVVAACRNTPHEDEVCNRYNTDGESE